MKSLTYRHRTGGDGAARPRGSAWRLRLLAVAAAAVLVSLAVAFGLLLTARKATLDALVIVTIPSGAEVHFDGRSLGPAPVTLEGVRVGPHTVRAVKEGFLPVEQEVALAADRDAPLELKLKPIAPPGSVARTPAEQIDEFTSLAEDAFARGELVLPADRSALYYTDAILAIDRKSGYAREMRARIRARLVEDAKAASARKDLVRAKAAYDQLRQSFPGDPEAAAGLAAVDEQLRRERSRVQEVVARGERQLRAGHLVEPDGRSAYAYATQALAIDPDNQQARGLRRRVRDRALAEARALVAAQQTEPALALLRRLVSLFPEDRPIRSEIDTLLAGDARAALRERRDAGMSAYGSGSYRAAVEQLQAAARLGPLDAAAYAALGMSHMRLGNAAEARRALERAVLQDGRRADALVALATLAERRGDLKAAVRYLRRAAELGGTADQSRERLLATAAEYERRLGIAPKPRAGAAPQ